MTTTISADNGTVSGSAGLKSTADSSGILALQTGANTTAVTIDASQNVGIGTSSPSAKLNVVSTGANSRIAIGDTAASTYSTLLMYGGSGKYNFQIGVQNNVNNAFEITPSTAVNGTTFSTPAVVLDSSGRLGIGTSSPNRLLSLYATQPVFQITNVASGNTQGTIQYQVSGSTDFVLDNQGSGSGGVITFMQAGSERARIDSTGYFLVGKSTTSDATVGFSIVGAGGSQQGAITTTLSGSTNTNTTMQVYSTGAAAYRFYVGLGGQIYATSTSINGISDQRLKENIRDLDDGLNVVMALKPRKFDWKEGKGANIKNARGFIAQEFEQVFPDLIDTWKDPAPEGEEPYKSVRQDLIPVLVKAIQEQQALIESLTTRLTALEQA